MRRSAGSALFLWVGVLAGLGCSESASSPADASGAGSGGSAAGGVGATGGSGGTQGTAGLVGDAGGADSSGGSAGTAGGGGAGAPAFAGDLKLTSLTPIQKAALCDWFVGLTGGYGVENACSAVTSVKTYDNQDQCVQAGLNFNCPILTAGQFETCALAMVPSHGCEYPDAECHWLFCR
jgi:hypothetical protein